MVDQSERKRLDGLRLMRAFFRIKDSERRRDVIDLAERMARDFPQVYFFDKSCLLLSIVADLPSANVCGAGFFWIMCARRRVRCAPRPVSTASSHQRRRARPRGRSYDLCGGADRTPPLAAVLWNGRGCESCDYSQE